MNLALAQVFANLAQAFIKPEELTKLPGQAAEEEKRSSRKVLYSSRKEI